MTQRDFSCSHQSLGPVINKGCQGFSEPVHQRSAGLEKRLWSQRNFAPASGLLFTYQAAIYDFTLLISQINSALFPPPGCYDAAELRVCALLINVVVDGRIPEKCLLENAQKSRFDPRLSLDWGRCGKPSDRKHTSSLLARKGQPRLAPR